MPVHVRQGRSIGYTLTGHGFPLLAIHGTTQAASAWDQVRDAGHVDATWVCAELPGSGESSLPNDPIDLDEVVDGFVDLMHTLGHRRFDVVGYSLGAVVALRLAATNAESVRSVASVCGWMTTDARMRLTFDLWSRLIEIDPSLFMRYALVDGYTAAALELLEPMADAAATMAATTVQPGSLAHLDLDRRIDIADSVASVTMPCLVVGGLQDRWVDVSHSRQIASVVPRATLVEIDAGHLLPGERAGELAAVLAAHLSKLSGD